MTLKITQILWNLLLVFTIFQCTISSHAQSPIPLSGVINSYHKARILSHCNGTLFVPNATSNFTIGQEFVLIQMQGAVTDTSTTNYGSVIEYNGAGKYEINSIRTIKGDTIECEFVFTNEYRNSDASLQIVPIIRYPSVSIVDSVVAKPWDTNNLGGVVVLFADTIFLDGIISADQKGFLGGDVSTFRDTCDIFDLGLPAINNGVTGQKGYGISEAPFNHKSGIGAFANAGGAGAGHNSGAGGGSNRTNAGKGGKQYPVCDLNLFNGGFGGKEALEIDDSTRLFLGGGGGGGQQNNNLATKGGIGGGIIICKTKHLQTIQGGSFTATGQTPPIGGNDSQGGGGAGGTIVLNADSIIGQIILNVQGGDGGTCRNTLHGAGGGGSGGVAILNDTLTTSLVIQKNGGNGGIGGVDNAANRVYKGENGEEGISLQNQIHFAQKRRRNALLTVNSLVPTSVCKGDTVTLEFSDNDVNSLTLFSSSLEIQKNPLNQYSVIIDTATTFTVYYSYDYDCLDTFSFAIGVNPRPNKALSLTNDVTICVNDSITITAIDSSARYQWNNGDTTRSITVKSAGQYFVRIENSFGCDSYSDTIAVSISPFQNPQFNEPKTITICPDSSTTISIANTSEFVSYRWNTNDTTPTISVTTPGKYFVQTVNQKGCLLFSDTVEIQNYSVVPSIATSIQFDSVDIVNEKLLTISLINQGLDEFAVSTKLLNDNTIGFSLMNSNQSTNLLPGQSQQTTIRFFPVQQIEYTDSLEITILSPCRRVIYVPIYGYGRGHFITKLSLPDTSLSVFDRNVTIPLTISLTPSYTIPFSTLEYSIEFEGGAFYPIEQKESRYSFNKANTLSSLFVQHTEPLLFGSTLTIPIRGDVLLGEQENNRIVISNAQWSNSSVNYIDSIEVKNGSIQLTELCFDGGIRLLKPFNSQFSLTALSTIVDDKIDVIIDCKEVGEYSLKVFTLQGNEIHSQQFSHTLQQNAKKQISISISTFASGMYILQCSSPTNIDRISIIKQ
ncbi:MAG: hypothetical protein JNL36_08420 [Candidatus Kapabacteria bacterium]|nr:hypothetical protein [Candidatus Kapabacteria bacterium]